MAAHIFLNSASGMQILSCAMSPARAAATRPARATPSVANFFLYYNTSSEQTVKEFRCSKKNERRANVWLKRISVRNRWKKTPKRLIRETSS